MQSTYNTRADERRSKPRYSVQLAARYVTAGQVNRITGDARTVDISSSGVLLISNRELPIAVRVELVIDWPFPLHGAPLEFVVRGTIIRSEGGSFAVQFENTKFRTVRGEPEHEIVAINTARSFGGNRRDKFNGIAARRELTS